MSLIQRVLASIGIGSSKVDTRLDSARLSPGGDVRGIVSVSGGNVEQRVASIYLQLMTQYIRKRESQTTVETSVIQRFKVSEPLTVRPGETVEVPFRFTLPAETPATIADTPVWLQTALDIEKAVDPTDLDHILVEPHPYARVVLTAAEQLGFRLRKAQCEYSPRLGRGLPFVQSFEFEPSPRFRSRLDELEFIFFPHPGGVDVLVEVDRHSRTVTGFMESSLEIDERKQVLRFSAARLALGPGEIAEELEQLISYHAK